MKMSIKGEFIPGTDILEAFTEATAFATRNNVQVTFDFNGVYCIAAPNGSPQLGKELYHKAIKSGTNIATN